MTFTRALMRIVLIALLPCVALAQDSVQERAVYTPVRFGAGVLTIIDSIIIPLIFTLALGSFIFGTLQYFVQGSHDDEIRQKSVALIIYGLVGFVAMGLMWAGIHIFAGTLGF